MPPRFSLPASFAPRAFGSAFRSNEFAAKHKQEREEEQEQEETKRHFTWTQQQHEADFTEQCFDEPIDNASESSPSPADCVCSPPLDTSGHRNSNQLGGTIRLRSLLTSSLRKSSESGENGDIEEIFSSSDDSDFKGDCDVDNADRDTITRRRRRRRRRNHNAEVSTARAAERWDGPLFAFSSTNAGAGDVRQGLLDDDADEDRSSSRSPLRTFGGVFSGTQTEGNVTMKDHADFDSEDESECSGEDDIVVDISSQKTEPSQAEPQYCFQPELASNIRAVASSIFRAPGVFDHLANKKREGNRRWSDLSAAPACNDNPSAAASQTKRPRFSFGSATSEEIFARPLDRWGVLSTPTAACPGTSSQATPHSNLRSEFIRASAAMSAQHVVPLSALSRDARSIPTPSGEPTQIQTQRESFRESLGSQWSSKHAGSPPASSGLLAKRTLLDFVASPSRTIHRGSLHGGFADAIQRLIQKHARQLTYLSLALLRTVLCDSVKPELEQKARLLLPLSAMPFQFNGVALPHTQGEYEPCDMQVLEPGDAFAAMILESSADPNLPNAIALCRVVLTHDFEQIPRFVFFLALFPAAIFRRLRLVPGSVVVLCAYTVLPISLPAGLNLLPCVLVLSAPDELIVSYEHLFPQGTVAAGTRVAGTVVRVADVHGVDSALADIICPPFLQCLNSDLHSELMQRFSNEPPFIKQPTEAPSLLVRSETREQNGRLLDPLRKIGVFRQAYHMPAALESKTDLEHLHSCVRRAAFVRVACDLTVFRSSDGSVELECLPNKTSGGFVSIILQNVRIFVDSDTNELLCRKSILKFNLDRTGSLFETIEAITTGQNEAQLPCMIPCARIDRVVEIADELYCIFCIRSSVHLQFVAEGSQVVEH